MQSFPSVDGAQGDDMEKPQPQVAFIAAFLALLVLPLLALFGLSALGLAAGMLAPVDRMMNGNAAWVLLGLFVVWVVLVVAAIVGLVSRLGRRIARP
jgi:hypothetical protein